MEVWTFGDFGRSTVRHDHQAQADNYQPGRKVNRTSCLKQADNDQHYGRNNTIRSHRHSHGDISSTAQPHFTGRAGSLDFNEVEDAGNDQQDTHQDAYPGFADEPNLLPGQDAEQYYPQAEQKRTHVSTDVETKRTHNHSLDFFV
jgi:hypothetical protein